MTGFNRSKWRAAALPLIKHPSHARLVRTWANLADRTGFVVESSRDMRDIVGWNTDRNVRRCARDMEDAGVLMKLDGLDGVRLVMPHYRTETE